MRLLSVFPTKVQMGADQHTVLSMKNSSITGIPAEDYEAAHKKHEEMGCICFENEAMGIYFIVDSDGYWLEILP